MAISGKALSHASEEELVALEKALDLVIGGPLCHSTNELQTMMALRTKVSEGLAIRRKMDARRA